MWQECLNLREELEMDALKLMSEGSLKETPPEFSIGDTVRVGKADSDSEVVS